MGGEQHAGQDDVSTEVVLAPGTSPVTIRTAATREDRAACYALRYAVYVDEMDELPTVSSGEPQELTDASDERAWIVMAEQDGAVVGTCRVISGDVQPFSDADRRLYDIDRVSAVVDERRIAIIDRFILAPEVRGGPLPLAVLRAVLRYTLAHRVLVGLGEAHAYMVGHYVALGFRPWTPPIRREAGHDSPVALLSILDGAYHESIGSLLADLLPHTEEPELVARVAALIPDPMPVRSRALTGTAFDRELASWLTHLSSTGWPTLDDHVAAALAPLSHIIDWPEGTELVSAGQGQRTMFLVLHGTASVTDSSGRQIHCAGPGEFLGEVGFLGVGRRVTTVVSADCPLTTVSFSTSALTAQLQANPALGLVFYQQIARSLGTKLRDHVATP